jgi:hypothetical protein
MGRALQHVSADTTASDPVQRDDPTGRELHQHVNSERLAPKWRSPQGGYVKKNRASDARGDRKMTSEAGRIPTLDGTRGTRP